MNIYHIDDIPKHLQKYFEPAPEIGTEPTPKEFINRLVRIFREARRVLRDDGTLWVNLGDSYTQSGKGGNPKDSVHRKQATNRGSLIKGRKIPEGYKPKDRIGIPHMFAFAMREDGWYWRDEIVWYKPNGMTESITDRCTKAHEFIFMFSKSERYYFDYFSIRESGHKNEDGEFDPSDENSRNKRSVWKVTVGADRIKHFATYPPKLIVPCILAGTSQGGCCADCGSPYERVLKRKRIPTRPGKDTKVSGKSPTEIGNRDPKRHIVSVKSIGWRKTCECETAGVGKCVVLDPFCGSGTTLMIAIEKGCEGIGIELNKDYIQFIKTKVKKANRRRGLFA